jgi:hypothetical protein
MDTERLIWDGIRSLQDDKERALLVGKRFLSTKHAVKWALIGVCLGSGTGMIWMGYGQA